MFNDKEDILMKVLSLFDGMSCGMLAMKSAGIDMTSREGENRYVAYEIDKNAIEVSRHNFPMIEHKGDVFKADFTEYKGFDFVIGGSPCTFWSIAQQPEKRETEAHGMGWDLFQQYVRAIKEAEPKYFIYENNKSMAPAIRESISGAFGFEPICINSALVSAQNRQRLYWVGIRNEDGTYRKANIEQPEDRGVFLKDILESGWDLTSNDKSFYLTARYQGAVPWNTIERAQRTMVAEPVPLNMTKDGESQCIRATCYKDGIRNMVGNNVDKKTCVAEPVSVSLQVVGRKKRNADGEWERSYIARTDGKASTLTLAENRRMVAEPVAVASRTRDNDDGTRTKKFEARGNKANCLTTVRTDSMVAEPIAGRMVGRRINEDGHRCDYNKDVKCVQRFEVNKDPDKANCLTTVQKNNMVAEPVEVRGMNYELAEVYDKDEGVVARLDMPKCHDILTRVYGVKGKSPTITAMGGGNVEPKVFSNIDTVKSKTETPIYEVKDGKITIKGRQYPIKLADGFYIIRKLTVTECKRLQTVPDEYDMSVISNTQAYRCLGNGWTVEVIAHLIKGALKD